MGLELLAISLGLSSFDHLLRKRRVVVHSDNTGSEAASKKGTAKYWDHAQLVHAQWLHAAMSGVDMHVIRVATDDNIADLPSRMVRDMKHWARGAQRKTKRAFVYQEFEILESAEAVFLPPRLDSMYANPAAWEVLQERWALR